MNYYKIYNIIVKTNIEIYILDKILETNNFSDQIVFDLKWERKKIKKVEDVNVIIKDTVISVSNSICNYIILLNDKLIKSFSDTIEEMVSTLFNLPFSYISLYYGNIIFHGSSIVSSKRAYIFCAEKGVGKTTLVSRLLHYFNFYYDDTLLVDRELRSYGGYKFLKIINPQIPTIAKEKLLKNIQGKFYVPPNYISNYKIVKDGKILDTIFILRRCNESKVKFKKINDFLSKKMLLLSSIVGIDYLDYKIIKTIESLEIFNNIMSKINVVQINVPNDLINLDENIIIIKKYICKESYFENN